MVRSAPPFLSLAFAKTPTGKSVIETKSAPLSLLERRLLLLIDGVKTGQDLTQYCVGKDVSSMLQSLIDQGFIEIIDSSAAPAAQPADATAMPRLTTPAAKAAKDESNLELPPASQRTHRDVEMARNFMINTITTIFPLYSQLTLMEAIRACETSVELRQVFLRWEDVMASNRIGLKRLPEFKEKLFAVL